MILKLLPFILTIVCSCAQAAAWVKAYEDSNEKIYLDMDSLTTVRGKQKIWVRWTFTHVQTRLGTTHFQSYLKLKYYDCPALKATTSKVVAYQGPDWKGPIVYQSEYPDIKRNEDDVFPSVHPPGALHPVYRMVCARVNG